MSESESTLADGVVLRPGERDRDCDDVDNADDDDVVERRRGAVSAGPWYVRADNAIRMSGGSGGVCTGGEVPWNVVWASQTRVEARWAAGAEWSSAAMAASRVEGWWCRYSHCTGDEE